MPYKYNPLVTLGLDLVGAAGGGGTVTSVAGGVGITNTPEPIVGAGTVDLDIQSLTTIAGAAAAGDWLALVDISAGGTQVTNQRKIALTDLADAIESILGGPWVDGAGAAGRATFWLDTDTVTSSADFLYDSTLLALTVGTSTSVSDTSINAGNAGYTFTVGGTLLSSRFNAHTDSSANAASFASRVYSTSAPNVGNTLHLRSRGTVSAPTIVVSGDTLLRLDALGYDGTDYELAASIRAAVDATPGANDMPGRLMFFTTPDGSATPVERFRIGHAGQLGIGGATYGTAGQVLTSGGAAAPPTWAAAAASIVAQLNDATIDAAATTFDVTEPNLAVAPSVFSSSPAGEVNLDLGQYVLRSGRSGSTNNITISTTTTGTIVGSVSAASLLLQSNVSTPQFVDITDRSKINSLQSAAIAGSWTMLDFGPVSASITTGSFRTLSFGTALTHTDNHTAIQGFRWQPTHTSGAATNFTLGTHQLLQVQPTYSPGAGSTFGLTSLLGVHLNPTYADAGILNTNLSHYAARATGTLNGTLATTWTITDWAAAYITQPAGAGGTIERLGGLRVGSLTRGVFNYSVWSEGAAVPLCHGGPAVFGTVQTPVPAAPTANTTLEVAASSTSSFRNATRSVFPPTANQAITLATNTILANATFVDVSNTTAGSITLTSTPTIADGEDGMWLCILNVGTQNVVVQDQGTLPLSNLRLTAATRTLGPRDTLILRYSSDIGDWVEIGFTNVI